MQYNFDASQIDPSNRPDGLPADRYLFAITREEDKATKPGTPEQGRALTFYLTVLQGPLINREQRVQMNLENQNETTVRIANAQLSAFAHVTGQIRFTDTRQMFNIPFWGEVGPQKKDPDYMELKKVWDVNGNEPKLNGQSAVSIAPAGFPAPAAPAFAPPASVQPQWGPQAPANPMQNGATQFPSAPGSPSAPFAANPMTPAPVTTFPSSPPPAVPGAGWQQGAPVVKAPWAK